ncbi:MAG: alpha/beta hydrolase [Rubrivivax sp.]
MSIETFTLRPPRTTRPTRSTIVLLHASASSSRQWDLLAEAIGSDAEVHAVDLHGHGGRAPFGGTLRLRDDAALLQPLIDRAGAVHLVGHSYGGALALHLALQQPARVRSLALYEPVSFSLLADLDRDHPATQEPRGIAEALRRLHAQGRDALAAERFIDYWSGTGTWARMGAARQASVSAKVPVLIAHFDALAAEPSPAAQLQRLTMPLLCLSGDATTLAARRIAARLAERLPQARHETLPRLGHMGPVTHAPQVNARLLDFLQHHGGLQPRHTVPPAPPQAEAIGLA